jgi:hypothetical protein
MGLPQQLEGEVYPGVRREWSGELTNAANGCDYLVIDGVARLAIWPRGSTLSNPVRLPDGTELADGDQVRGTGSILAAKDLPGGRAANGYWAHVTGFCTGDVPEVIVLDEVRREE